MTVLFVIVAAAGLTVWVHKADIRSDNKFFEDGKIKAEANTKIFLDEEMFKPRYYVEVLTKTGKVYATEKFEPYSKPKYWELLGWIDYHITSIEQATNKIESYIGFGCFCDVNTNTYIPLCEIEHFKAKKFGYE